jgi:hypothetical protein
MNVTKNTSLDFSIPFDIPMLPCQYFKGRDDVLREIDSFFYGNIEKVQARRTFAICGLGGSALAI